MAGAVLHGDFISDGGVLWRAEDTRLYGFVADIPNFYERESLFTMSSDRIKIITPSRLLVNINNHGYIAEQSYTLNINSTAYYDSASVSMATASSRIGKNIYIYAVEKPNTEVPGFVLSANSTVPSGYTASTSRKLGGFHCLCANAGTIAGHPYSGYTAGNILPLSIWDLKHRPIASPEGMVWVEEIGKWVDIYLNSWDGTKLASVYNGVIACGNSNSNHMWNGEKFVEYLAKVKKTLPTRDEFSTFSKQSNERTNISRSANPVRTGGHMDTNSLRMISNYSLEDCCGVVYQWTTNLVDDVPGSNYTEKSYWMSWYNWNTDSVFKDGVNSPQCGDSYGLLRRIATGGAYNSGTHAGSRCVRMDLLSANNLNVSGARGVSLPKEC